MPFGLVVEEGDSGEYMREVDLDGNYQIVHRVRPFFVAANLAH